MTSIKWTDTTDIDKARRERIATAVLQGLLASGRPYVGMTPVKNAIDDAVKHTDALIAELDRTGKK